MATKRSKKQTEATAEDAGAAPSEGGGTVDNSTQGNKCDYPLLWVPRPEQMFVRCGEEEGRFRVLIKRADYVHQAEIFSRMSGKFRREGRETAGVAGLTDVCRVIQKLKQQVKEEQNPEQKVILCNEKVVLFEWQFHNYAATRMEEVYEYYLGPINIEIEISSDHEDTCFPDRAMLAKVINWRALDEDENTIKKDVLEMPCGSDNYKQQLEHVDAIEIEIQGLWRVALQYPLQKDPYDDQPATLSVTGKAPDVIVDSSLSKVAGRIRKMYEGMAGDRAPNMTKSDTYIVCQSPPQTGEVEGPALARFRWLLELALEEFNSIDEGAKTIGFREERDHGEFSKIVDDLRKRTAEESILGLSPEKAQEQLLDTLESLTQRILLTANFWWQEPGSLTWEASKCFRWFAADEKGFVPYDVDPLGVYDLDEDGVLHDTKQWPPRNHRKHGMYSKRLAGEGALSGYFDWWFNLDDVGDRLTCLFCLLGSARQKIEPYLNAKNEQQRKADKEREHREKENKEREDRMKKRSEGRREAMLANYEFYKKWIHSLWKEEGDGKNGKKVWTPKDKPTSDNELSGAAAIRTEAKVDRWLCLQELPIVDYLEDIKVEATVAMTHFDKPEDIVKQLDKHVHGLDDAKISIARQLLKRRYSPAKGRAVCLLGPPGVGKSTLAETIATVAGREFVRVDLSGLAGRDIVGYDLGWQNPHFGKIVQAMRKAESANPVMLLEHVDQVNPGGASGNTGDPFPAVRQVVDPEENQEFMDELMETPYNLSSVVFIVTASDPGVIPISLLNVMECVFVIGHSEHDKEEIVKKHLLMDICENELGLKSTDSKSKKPDPTRFIELVKDILESKRDAKSGSSTLLGKLIEKTGREPGVTTLHQRLSSMITDMVPTFIKLGALSDKREDATLQFGELTIEIKKQVREAFDLDWAVKQLNPKGRSLHWSYEWAEETKRVSTRHDRERAELLMNLPQPCDVSGTEASCRRDKPDLILPHLVFDPRATELPEPGDLSVPDAIEKKQSIREQVKQVRARMKKTHLGMDGVKDDLVDLYARDLRLRQHQEQAGERISSPTPICLLGPPGIGKTSICETLAKAIGRKFGKVSVGGSPDEAEIRGSKERAPGSIVREMRRLGTFNPIIMLDEVDKLDEGSPKQAALLELLEPGQNTEFVDKYLGLPYDLSAVMFIATANYEEKIPEPLKNRMRIVRLTGYQTSDKLEIMKRHLLPNALRDSGIVLPDVLEDKDDKDDSDEREAEKVKAYDAIAEHVLGESLMDALVEQHKYDAGLRRIKQDLERLIDRKAREFQEMQDGKDSKLPNATDIKIVEKDVNDILGPANAESSSIIDRLDRRPDEKAD